jgi:trehalose/maltose hydrolase-like predicted phosphorylase
MYRYHTLPAARAKAKQIGCGGALYAWESADTGVETTPDKVVANDGRILDILTGKMEQHISADIAYAVWRYWRATEDDEFFLSAGAEIVLETARFWASRAVLEPDGKRHIRHVIGPDEYHEDVDDSAFTSMMARWNIARAIDAIDILMERWPYHASELFSRLELSYDEIADWHDAVGNIATGLDSDTGLFEQFSGFHALEKIDLALYADRTQPIDVIIGAERTRRSQVVKQADIVALIALLPEEFPDGIAERNFRHYEPICGHGSSLSAGMHARVAARLGHTEVALHYLREAAALDLDLDPNSAGGVRIAGLGGLWQAVVFGFAGIDMSGDTLAIDPNIPEHWQNLSFCVCWKGRVIGLRISQRTARATLISGPPIAIQISGTRTNLGEEQDVEVQISPHRAPSQITTH